MNENQLILLTINDLLNPTPRSFTIPAYQRGYRWTPQQIKDLLDDIFEFHQNKQPGEYYCLQPVVVKARDDQWEVIDGQQRLTSIYLLLKYFNDRMADEYRTPLYKLAYETREASAAYLNNLNQEASRLNVDFYHIYQAFQEIKNWFSTRRNLVNDIESTLLNSTKIIWYQVNEEIDSIDIFTRLNSGKVQLTNAELIKALFLFEDNFKENDQTKLRQYEIASEWDRMETELRDEEFWGFIYNGQKKYENHIEYIFDLICNKTNQDKDYTFREYSNRFKVTNNVDESWAEVKNYFLTFHEWYNEHQFFHLIGYLVTVGDDIAAIRAKKTGRTKSQFKDDLVDRIKEHVNYQVRDLDYTTYRQRNDIKKVLLLFNIVTIINNPGSNYRFQFGRYKEGNWDLEHIHATKSEIPGTDEHQRDWLREIMDYTSEEDIRAKITQWFGLERKTRTADFENLYDEILRKYSEHHIIEDINDISNLTLLDSGTNRSYKNSIFPVKRGKIIGRDEAGTFIPLCTKNAFLKYYNRSVEQLQMTFWGARDRQYYLNAIIETLDAYLPQQNN